ncbi:MAG: carboxynorspermidine decarboxylase [Muribaculaceae bacterium]|nr:carboxynorspermidine decarboxylase [Muribaculaceae bacterium]
MMKIEEIPTPFYIVYETRLRRNLELINRVEREAGVNIIMAFKANALWRTFHIVREYNRDFTASSLNELRLGNEELGGEAHVYCPVYTDSTIDEFLSRATHLTFNSLSQWEKYGARAIAAGVSPGLRVNPQCSVIETEIYNPALPGSRFGVTADQLGGHLPEGIEGLHFHALCESDSHDLEKVLAAFEEQFGSYLPQLKWVNFGGGHLMTREGYDTDHLINLLRGFRSRYPWLKVVMEPGSAFTWRTGDLITSVLDVVENQGVSTAIIDASFACHMPDCLEMPYKPAITESTDPAPGLPVYRLGGNSCLSGDYVGDWTFATPLTPGTRLTLEDMNHYTTVKTNMFNGIAHPAMVLCDADGDCRYLRQFDYMDYKNRMS